MKKKKRQLVPNSYIIIMLAFLYIPIMVMIALSFNQSAISSVWGGFPGLVQNLVPETGCDQSGMDYGPCNRHQHPGVCITGNIGSHRLLQIRF